MPETITLCPGCKKNPRGQSSPYCVECYVKRQKPLPAHDAPQVEPKRLWTATESWVRYTDYATLEAEKQQLEDENRELRRELGNV